MIGYRFGKFDPKTQGNTPFERLLDIFLKLSLITSGNWAETIDWMNELDRQFGLTTDDYGMGYFIEDLKSKGYIEDNPVEGGIYYITPKTEKVLRQKALEDVFGKLKKGKGGMHQTTHAGQGDEWGSDRRNYLFGDALDRIDLTASIRNAQVNSGIHDFVLREQDLEIVDKEYKTQTSTVVMIDISHSMILYGEDRITPAKQVAMALAEFIKVKYPKDTLDIITFGDDAAQISIKDLPYLQVGPYHTNTVAGLELATDILRRRKNKNKQIFMITDGKPTCLKQGIRYYKNSFGLDRKIVNKTINYAIQCRRAGIHITTFMIASDPYLVEFVEEFTAANGGKAYYSGLDGLGSFLMQDFQRNRRRKV